MTEATEGGFGEPCPECGWAPTKPDRSRVRRSLARHLINEHDFDPDPAWALAYQLVPRHPDERGLDAPARS
jgi:hypothetical protein